MNIGKIILVVTMIGLVNNTHASWEGYALVTAKPESVKFLSEHETSDSEEDKDFFYGSLFKVTLTELQVIYGSLDAQELDVEITATHKEVLDNKKEIFALLDISGDGPQVLYWGIPNIVACIPKQLTENRGISDNFPIKDFRHKRVCTNAEWFQ